MVEIFVEKRLDHSHRDSALGEGHSTRDRRSWLHATGHDHYDVIVECVSLNIPGNDVLKPSTKR